MHASDICPSWINEVLHEAGLLDASVTVTDVDARPIGTGQVADSIQVEAHYSGSTDAPASFVLKVSSENEQSRSAGRTEMNYLREVRFYQDIAPRLKVRVPACHHAEIDSNRTEFVLVLEDLSPARPGDQLRGCTVEETALAVVEAARIHAPFWGSEELAGNPWLDISGTYWARFVDMMPQWWSGFEERYGTRLSSADIALGRTFTEHIADYYAALRTVPFTVQHGDFRPDNVLFDAAGGDVPLAVLDWQTAIFGPGIVDVAYFIGGALSPDARRAHEAQLLKTYYDELRALGVVNYSFEDLLRDYPIGTFQNFVIGVAAAMLVVRTERGDDLFVSMVSNSLAHARDRDAMTRILELSKQAIHA
ncbi:phosphotransferase [Rhodococcus erythropolis]|uniref:Phosphotransferase n=1 Tax=Rhodococcus erythropolis TaxID=1833 RepID=A0A8I1D4V5_RHOER|nr:phosphotransferase [Rhodococcus erythropolis]MBH5143535.1 phosphotransferase [Rhodococcus erythropolis]